MDLLKDNQKRHEIKFLINSKEKHELIDKNQLKKLVDYCKEINLDLIGLMCIPPANINPEIYFDEMKNLNQALGFKELSMGMSSDFLAAIKYSATYVRVGSSIFGERS